MKVLILDDVQERHDWFAAQFRASGRVTTWHAYSVIEAKAMLDDHVFDVAFLDHDLECTDPRGDGLQVANYIAAMPTHERPGTCVVHSWNPDGAARMVASLERQCIPTHTAAFGSKELARIAKAVREAPK